MFVSVSIDSRRNWPKWLDFIAGREMRGVQLFGGNGWESDVARFYGIKAIPRFMLFDKAGNIVTTDAPRPSSHSLRQMIDSALAD